ncbi:gephyrin isoform X1 [Camponotus floridanus]|uniref:gephyrin isoform X1 n=1 Tax=Camponotus floridanus TaxID=104421 RepID=UPI000DC69D0C|nr:gephyrin isoform X1 [Camponotus floridanus]
MAKKSIKYGILCVYTQNFLWENADMTLAYNCEMNELITFIKNTFTENFNAEVIDISSELKESDITEKIRFWCDGNEPVDIIFIIGYTTFDSSDKPELERIITKQITKKYEDTQLLETLERPFQRSFCGKRYKTRIFNFFGFCNEEVVTFINSTARQLKCQLRLIPQEEILQIVPSASCISSNNNNNNADQEADESQIQSDEEDMFNILLKVGESQSHEKVMLNLHIEKENIRPNITFEPASPSTSFLTKEDDTEKKEPKPSFSSNKFTKMIEENARQCYRESQLLDSERVHVDQVAEHDETSAYLTTNQSDIASESEVTITAESPPLIKFELNFESQDDSDSESLSAESMDEKEEDTITVKNALLEIQRIVKSVELIRSYKYINTEDSHGRILAESVYSDCNVPAFRAATKHGYAVLASDNVDKRVVLDRITADPVSLIPGTCTYVMSGQRVPDEATAVVSIKNVKQIINDNMPLLILIKIKPKFGQNIKDIGSDIRKNKIIIPAFTRIGPTELGLLTATGRQRILVMEPVPIGILSIGEFLVEPGEPLRPGFVYDSNRISLIALLKDKGFNSIVDFGIVTHDTQSIKMKIEEALNQVNVLVTIGCSNDNDMLKPILKNNFDATIHFGNVFLKPGKSTTFATCTIDDKMKYFVCLSKNPVSAFVSAHLFLVPFLNGIHHMFEKPCKIPARIQQRYILHQRPRAAWANLQWKKRDNIARAYSKKNLCNDKPVSCQAANALLLLPQKTVDQEVLNKSFVPACLIK